MRDVWVVLPGKRAGLFLKEAIRKAAPDRVLWLPKILSIDEFISLHSPLHAADSIQTVLHFYEVYKADPDHTDGLDAFLNWASTLVSDFDDADRYMVDIDMLFRNLKSVKELEEWPVDEWSYDSDELKPLQTEFLDFWRKLPKLYQDLNVRLEKHGLGRKGMIYRKVAENAEKFFANTRFNKVYFCGLNAVSESELQIMKHLVRENKADVYWEIQPELLKDPLHEASFFVKRNLETVGKNLFDVSNKGEPQIHVHGASNFYAQSLVVSNLLKADEDNRTAVILCNESLLEPVQKHLPQLHNPVNITTEFPLKQTGAYNLFKTILQLNIKRIRSGSGKMYFKDLLNIIQHPAFGWFAGNDFKAGKLTRQIHKHNMIYLDPKLNDISPETGAIVEQFFFAAKNMQDVCGFLNCLISQIERAMSVQEPSILIKEQFYHLSSIFDQLITTIETIEDATLQTLNVIMRQLLGEHNLSFKGEPLAGMQIMGMLETRSLNFDKVVFVGANEGALPQGGHLKSFIPYDLRSYFKMPGKKNKEAIHAFYFYRQLWCSKEVHLVYNADTSGADPKEPSRYILQLNYEGAYEHVQHHLPGLKTELSAEPVVIRKDHYVLQLIRQYLEQGLSPSAMGKFLNCPVDFFHRYILRLHEMDEAEEDIQDATFGSILHEVLEEFYLPVIGTKLTSEFYEDFKATTSKLLIKAFQNANFDTNELVGRNKLVFNICEHYLHTFIGHEKTQVEEGAEMTIIELEAVVNETIRLDGYESPIVIKGTIDRVDRYNGNLRIMDYKTGAVKHLSKTADPEDIFSSQDKTKELQLMLYGWLYAKKENVFDFNTGIFYLRQPASPVLLSKSISKELISSIETQLFDFLKQLIDPNIPFTEKAIPKYETLLGYQQ